MFSHARLALAYIAILAFLFTTAYSQPLKWPATTGAANPTPSLMPAYTVPSFLQSRAEPIFRNVSGVEGVYDPSPLHEIPQGTASDGSGTVGSAAYIIWTSFCFTVGVPLGLAGLRGWRLTIGVGLGCAGAGAAWATINNAVDENDLPDLIIVAIVFGFFFLGCILGLFEFARQGGLIVLAAASGVAIGVRVVLFRDSLLVPIYEVNWVIVGVFGAIMPIGFIWFDRLIIVTSCASLGTFLSMIGVELLVNKQDGVSRGLRFLFDRNQNHFADIYKNGYHPTLSTIIILGVSLGLIPALATLQHLYFKEPFNRSAEARLVFDTVTEPVTEDANGDVTQAQFDDDNAPLPNRYSRYPSIVRILGRDRPQMALLPRSRSRFSL